jgi:tetratricopeptide (TPR) repeat protein
MQAVTTIFLALTILASPHGDQLLFIRAQALWDQGKKQEAARAYRDLIKNYPNSRYVPEAYLAFGEYYFDEGKIEKALMAYKKVIQYKGSKVYSYALYKTGWCYFNIHEFERALEQFVAVVKHCDKQKSKTGQEPKLRREALNDAVLTYSHAGKANAAPAFFKRLAPGEARSLLEKLARMYYGHAKLQDAVFLYQHLLKQEQCSPQELVYQKKIVDCIIQTDNKIRTIKEAGRLVVLFGQVEKCLPNPTTRQQETLYQVKKDTEQALYTLAVSFPALEKDGGTISGIVLRQSPGRRDPQSTPLVLYPAQVIPTGVVHLLDARIQAGMRDEGQAAVEVEPRAQLADPLVFEAEDGCAGLAQHHRRALRRRLGFSKRRIQKQGARLAGQDKIGFLCAFGLEVRSPQLAAALLLRKLQHQTGIGSFGLSGPHRPVAGVVVGEVAMAALVLPVRGPESMTMEQVQAQHRLALGVDLDSQVTHLAEALHGPRAAVLPAHAELVLQLEGRRRNLGLGFLAGAVLGIFHEPRRSAGYQQSNQHANDLLEPCHIHYLRNITLFTRPQNSAHRVGREFFQGQGGPV